MICIPQYKVYTRQHSKKKKKTTYVSSASCVFKEIRNSPPLLCLQPFKEILYRGESQQEAASRRQPCWGCDHGELSSSFSNGRPLVSLKIATHAGQRQGSIPGMISARRKGSSLLNLFPVSPAFHCLPCRPAQPASEGVRHSLWLRQWRQAT